MKAIVYVLTVNNVLVAHSVWEYGGGIVDRIKRDARRFGGRVVAVVRPK